MANADALHPLPRLDTNDLKWRELAAWCEFIQALQPDNEYGNAGNGEILPSENHSAEEQGLQLPPNPPAPCDEGVDPLPQVAQALKTLSELQIQTVLDENEDAPGVNEKDRTAVGALAPYHSHEEILRQNLPRPSAHRVPNGTCGLYGLEDGKAILEDSVTSRDRAELLVRSTTALEDALKRHEARILAIEVILEGREASIDEQYKEQELRSMKVEERLGAQQAIIESFRINHATPLARLRSTMDSITTDLRIIQAERAADRQAFLAETAYRRKEQELATEQLEIRRTNIEQEFEEHENEFLQREHRLEVMRIDLESDRTAFQSEVGKMASSIAKQQEELQYRIDQLVAQKQEFECDVYARENRFKGFQVMLKSLESRLQERDTQYSEIRTSWQELAGAAASKSLAVVVDQGSASRKGDNISSIIPHLLCTSQEVSDMQIKQDDCEMKVEDEADADVAICDDLSPPTPAVMTGRAIESYEDMVSMNIDQAQRDADFGQHSYQPTILLGKSPRRRTSQASSFKFTPRTIIIKDQRPALVSTASESHATGSLTRPSTHSTLC